MKKLCVLALSLFCIDCDSDPEKITPTKDLSIDIKFQKDLSIDIKFQGDPDGSQGLACWTDMGISCCNTCELIYSNCHSAVNDANKAPLSAKECVTFCEAYVNRDWLQMCARNAILGVTTCNDDSIQSCFDKAFAPANNPCGCKSDEVCVETLDGTCTSMGMGCKKVSASCLTSGCTQACDTDFCGGAADAGINFTCQAGACAGFEFPGIVHCYGP